MRNIINFLSNRLHWLVFVLLEIISIVLVFSYNSYQRSAWVSSANSIAGVVYGIQADITSFFSLTKLNEELTMRNNYLQYQINNLTEELEVQGRDSVQIATAKMVEGFKMIPAKVVNNSINKRDNLITINKGEADGVRKNMGVISGTGVVGVVFITGEHYSVVIPALSSHSSISCKIDKKGYFGYLKWEGGPCNMAYVDDVPRHAHFKLYDRVVTSGFSSIFPPGIPVGKILHVLNSSDGISYRLQVQLYTDFSRLRDVCVVDNSGVHEQLELLREAQDSLTVKQSN